MNAAMVDVSSSGAMSCTWALPTGAPRTESIASRTPWSALISSWTTIIPRWSWYQAMAASRSGTAMPTWSIPVTRALASIGRASGRTSTCSVVMVQR